MMIGCILLAAGKSSRFNGNKLVAEFRGKPLIEHAIDKGIDLCEKKSVDKMVVVIPNGGRETMLKDGMISSEYMTIVTNERQDLGISHSIQLGLEACGFCDAYMFMVCDQPLLKTETLQEMVKCYKSGTKGIFMLGYKERKGNPVIFAHEYKEALMNLKGDVGGKAIIRCHKEDVAVYEVTNHMELADVDTVDVLEALDG